ncbi:MAG: 2-phosphosulfolactate phosphatase [Patescibacteria group bacterium]
MNINIYECLKGAKIANGITVVIDVFRASNTIISCLASGAEYILPVGALEKAYQLKKENPNHLLFGERGGLPLEGFDYDNSPAKATKLNLRDKKIIITTSAGSQCIVNATLADEILIGSFANSQAIIDYIKNKKPAQVSLLAVGCNTTEPAVEDEECAKYIEAGLKNLKINFDQIKNQILQSDGANRLRTLNQKDDLEFALKLNTYDIVPRFDHKTGKIFNCNI